MDQPFTKFPTRYVLNYLIGMQSRPAPCRRVRTQLRQPGRAASCCGLIRRYVQRSRFLAARATVEAMREGLTSVGWVELRSALRWIDTDLARHEPEVVPVNDIFPFSPAFAAATKNSKRLQGVRVALPGTDGLGKTSFYLASV